MKSSPASPSVGHRVPGGLSGGKASRPSAAASCTEELPAPETQPRVRTWSGPAPCNRGLRLTRPSTRANSSAIGTGSELRPMKPISSPFASPILPFRLESQFLAEQRVVAELGVGVERQVVAGERGVGVEQNATPRPSPASGARGWNSERPCRGRARAGRAGGDRRLERLAAGRDG